MTAMQVFTQEASELLCQSRYIVTSMDGKKHRRASARGRSHAHGASNADDRPTPLYSSSTILSSIFLHLLTQLTTFTVDWYLLY